MSYFLTGLIAGAADQISSGIDSSIKDYKDNIKSFGSTLFQTKQSNYQKYTQEYAANKKSIDEMTRLLGNDTSAVQYLVDTEGSIEAALAQAKLIGTKVIESGGALHPVDDFIMLAKNPNVNVTVEQLAQSYTTPYKTMPLGPMPTQGYMSIFDDDMSDDISRISNQMLDVSGIPRGDLGGGDSLKKAYEEKGTRGIRVWELNMPTDNAKAQVYLQNAAFVTRKKAHRNNDQNMMYAAAEIQHAADQKSILANLANRKDLTRTDKDIIQTNFLERLAIVHGTITDKMYQNGSFVTSGMGATQLDILTDIADDLVMTLNTALESGVSYAEADYHINEAIRQNKKITFKPLEIDTPDGGSIVTPDDADFKGSFVTADMPLNEFVNTNYFDYVKGKPTGAVGIKQFGLPIFENSMFFTKVISPETVALFSNLTVMNLVGKYKRQSEINAQRKIESQLREIVKNTLPKGATDVTISDKINDLLNR